MRWVVFLVALVVGPALPAWAQDIRIVDFTYPQHAMPGDPVVFRITVRNLETTAQFAEVDVTLTKVGTGAETTVTPVATGTVPAGGTLTITSTWTAVSGIYTVSLPLFDGNGVRHDRVAGKFPIHVGTNTDLLHAFPETLHLGTIPPGRYVHPVPIEIRWDFYRFNRLSVDQPFAIRVYTDNASRFRGVEGSLRLGSPAGLISDDGRFTIPLKVWTVNFGPDVQETAWDSDVGGAPPVDDDTHWLGPILTDGTRDGGSAAWLRVPDLSEMSANPTTWRRLIGQDPSDTRFVTDTNPTGDFTLDSPFTMHLALEAGPGTVRGTYSTTLVIELYSP